LKDAVADLTLENRLLEKSMRGDGGDEECELAPFSAGHLGITMEA
jgi:hypothetical protein